MLAAGLFTSAGCPACCGRRSRCRSRPEAAPRPPRRRRERRQPAGAPVQFGVMGAIFAEEIIGRANQAVYVRLRLRHLVLSRDPDSVRLISTYNLTRGSSVIPARYGRTWIPRMRIGGHSCPGRNSYPITEQWTSTCKSRAHGPLHKARPHRVAQRQDYGEPVERLTSDLNFNGQEAELQNVSDEHQSSVTGGATYNTSSHAFSFSLTGDNFDLIRISVLQSARIAVTGRADFTASGSGTLEQSRSMPPFICTTLPSTRIARASSPLTRFPRERSCGSPDGPSSNRRT